MHNSRYTLVCLYYEVPPATWFWLYGSTKCKFAISKVPPPPGISNTNVYSGPVRISEDKWNKDINVEIVGKVNLTRSREVKGLWMYEKNSPRIELNGQMIRVASEGINAGYSSRDIFIRGGVITSSVANLNISSAIPHDSRLILDVSISDNVYQRVGLFVNRFSGSARGGVVSLDGWAANTFTGDAVVEGPGSTLFLNKYAGVTAVRSNIYVRNGARVAVATKDQIADSSTVTLVGNGSMFSFAGTKTPANEKIHKLVVQSGNGILSFQHFENEGNRARRLFYFDDLVIANGASLTVKSWEAGRDYFLVRKNSPHLKDAFKKLMIEGWGKNQVYLKDYDKDYWSIEAAPEPSTYGTIFGVIGLGIFTWRRRYRMRRPF